MNESKEAKEYTAEYARLAKPLFDKIERLNYGTGIISGRFAAYVISEAKWNQLQAAADKDNEATRNYNSVQSEELAKYGFRNLYYKGTPVIFNAELEGDQVLGLETDLIRGLTRLVPAYNTISVEERNENTTDSPS